MTSSLSFMGSYSGITMDTVDQLIQAESGKLTQYTNQQAGLTNEKNAWKDINTRLDSLYKKFESLKQTATFDSKTVSNSNEKTVTVSAGTDALEGTYNVEVKKLATSSQVTSGYITTTEGKKTSATDRLSLDGKLTLMDTDKTAISIEVKGSDSLKDIVTKINDSAKENESGLRASIVDNRIVLMDSVGEQQITVEDGEIASKLALESGSEGRTDQLGSKSEIIVNGISITGNTNTLENAVEGLTFNLLTANEQVSTIKVAEDHEKTTEAVQAFVDQYNSVMTYIDEQLDVGDPSAEGNTTGALVGDSSLMRLQSQLRSLMTTSSKETTQSIKGLSDLGIEVDRYGKASLDSSKLNEQLAKNSNNVQSFFFREEAVLDTEGKDSGETKEVGMAQQMTAFINEYIADKTGIITTKSKTIDDMVKDLDEQITKFNERLESKRERYIKQFTALDTAMMEAESQLNYLMSQIGTNTES